MFFVNSFAFFIQFVFSCIWIFHLFFVHCECDHICWYFCIHHLICFRIYLYIFIDYFCTLYDLCILFKKKDFSFIQFFGADFSSDPWYCFANILVSCQIFSVIVCCLSCFIVYNILKYFPNILFFGKHFLMILLTCFFFLFCHIFPADIFLHISIFFFFFFGFLRLKNVALVCVYFFLIFCIGCLFLCMCVWWLMTCFSPYA